MIILGILTALGGGAIYPLMYIFQGQYTGLIVNYYTNKNNKLQKNITTNFTSKHNEFLKKYISKMIKINF